MPGKRRSSVASSSASIPAREYNVSDVVFARIKGYPPWPARVLEIKFKDENTAAKTKYTVLFYGTHETGTCKGSDLCMFEEFKEEMCSKNQNKKGLQAAIREAETNPEINLPVQDAVDEDSNEDKESSKDGDLSNKIVTNGSRAKKRQLVSNENKHLAKRLKDEKRIKTEMSSEDEQSADEAVKRNVSTCQNVMEMYSESHKNFLDRVRESKLDGLFDGVRPAVSKFLQQILLHAEMLPAKIDYSKEENLISELGEKHLSSLVDQLEEAKLKNWTKSDVFQLLNLTFNCPQSKRYRLLNRVAEKIDRGESPDFLQNIIRKEELDVMFPLGFGQSKFLQRQLLLKTVNSSDMVIPWNANESSFLRDFDFQPPSTTRRMLHFKHFQYVTITEENFVKIFAKEVLCMMKELQDSNLAPPFFKKIVNFALRMNDENFTAKEELLPLETRLKLRQIETDFRALVFELTDLLKSSENKENLFEDLLDKLYKLGRLEVTKVMLSKLPESVNLVHHLTKLNFSKDQTGDLENVISAAETVMKKFEGLLINEKLEQNEKREALFRALKVGNLALVRAAESRPALFLTISEEPIAVNMNFEELVKLQEEMHGNFEHKMEYCRLWAGSNGFFL